MDDDLDQMTFAREVRGGRPGLARAALLFAREIAYPGLRLSPYLARLDEWAEAVRTRTGPREHPLSRALRLAELLFEGIGLRGNADDYQDPRNSFLNEVIERRLGIPITLSAIFLEVAERVGLAAEGVGLPGHFLVAIRTEEERYFFDPFGGGAVVSQEDAARLVRQATGYSGAFQPGWLAPVTTEAILARMLSNLRSSYVSREAWPRAVAVVERLRVLQPHATEHVRDLGLIHYRAGALRASAEALEQYLLRTPAAPDVQTVRATLDQLLQQLARLN